MSRHYPCPPSSVGHNRIELTAPRPTLKAGNTFCRCCCCRSLSFPIVSPLGSVRLGGNGSGSLHVYTLCLFYRVGCNERATLFFIYMYIFFRLGFLFLFYFFHIYFIVVQVHLSPFPPQDSPPPQPPPLPTRDPASLWFCPCVLHSENPSLLSPSVPSPLSSGHLPFALHFSVFGSIWLTCLFC